MVADLSAARLDLNDVVKVESKFHGFENDDFLLTRRLYDKKKLRVTLDLMRNVNYSPSWAVDVAGGAYDSYAIDTNSDQDVNWTDRAYGNEYSRYFSMKALEILSVSRKVADILGLRESLIVFDAFVRLTNKS